MNKDPLSTPHQRGILPDKPSLKAKCDYLENVDNSTLSMPQTSDLIDASFYSEAESLKWSNGALSSPMGTAIPNPKSKK